MQEQQYHSDVKRGYQERMMAQDSEASRNAEQIAELERQERMMVEALNQSRMSLGPQSQTGETNR